MNDLIHLSNPSSLSEQDLFILVTPLMMIYLYTKACLKNIKSKKKKKTEKQTKRKKNQLVNTTHTFYLIIKIHPTISLLLLIYIATVPPSHRN